MRGIIVFLSFFVIALLAFLPGHTGMLVTDVNGWLNTYQKMGWQGLPHSFNDKSLHFLYHLAFFLCYKLFGFNTLCWGITYAALHAAVASAAFALFTKIYRAVLLPHPSITAYAGSLLFLLNAYMAEPVLWAACIHYLLCALFILWALSAMINYSTHGRASSIIWFAVCFVLAVFLLELSLALPFICIPLVFIFKRENISRQKFMTLIGVSVLAGILYFVINKIVLGSVVGHYGASTHLNTDPVLLVSNLNKYIAKYLVFCQFWKHEYLSMLFTWFEKPAVAYSSLAFYLLATVLFFAFHRRLSVRLRTALLLFAAAVAALAPVINLFVTYIVPNEGDRLAYLFALFFNQAFALFTLGGLSYGIIAVALYLGLNVHFLQKNVSSWKQAGLVGQQLISNYRWQNAPDVVILNMPDNFKGAYMFRSFGNESELQDALKTRGISSGRMVEVLKYNMNNATDCVTVEIVSPDELHVTLSQWGNWWWMNGIGAQNYETDEYTVRIDEWSHSYNIRFKKKIMGVVYLYQCGGAWKEVKGF